MLFRGRRGKSIRDRATLRAAAARSKRLATEEAAVGDNRVRIFDTTLRDGEQSPGINLNVKEKLEIAEQLARLGVDIIEAGFPVTSPGDFESVSAISQNIKGPSIAALARAHDADIDRAWEAVQHARQPRIHVFLSTSDIHRKYMLNATEDEILAQAISGVQRAKGYCSD